MDCGHLAAGRPVLWSWQPIGPSLARVIGSLVHNSSASMTLGEDGEDGLVVFEQDGGWVTEVLAFLFVDQNVNAGLVVQVNGWDRVVFWQRFLWHEQGGGDSDEHGP